MTSQHLNRDTHFRPFQHYAVDWIKERLWQQGYCALWAKMGLGKTIITLTVLDELFHSFDIHRVLVIAPLRVARKTWDDELAKWSHLNDLRIAHILGTEKQRIKAMRSRADVYLINRENVTWLVNQHFNVVEKKDKNGNVVDRFRGRQQLRPWIWDTVVIDESSSFKRQSSKRWKSLKFVRRLFDKTIHLTGTPSATGLSALWAQVYLLDRGQRLGMTETAYRHRWFEPPEREFGKWRLKFKRDMDGTREEWAEEQIQQTVNDVCLTLREEDYLDLPPILFNPVKVTLSTGEMQQYRQMARDAVMELDGEEITAANAGALMGKLLQLANGSIYHSHPNYKTFHAHKLNALEELLDVATGPAIVVYSYVSDQHRIEGLLRQLKANWRTLDTTQDEDDWNNGLIDVLVMHPASGGHGLNLHHSDSELMIFYGLPWSLELYQQMLARLCGGFRRMGKNVVVNHIICEGTADYRVLQVLADNDATQERLFEATKVIVSEVMG